jgi:hypothetical protein
VNLAIANMPLGDGWFVQQDTFSRLTANIRIPSIVLSNLSITRIPKPRYASGKIRAGRLQFEANKIRYVSSGDLADYDLSDTTLLSFSGNPVVIAQWGVSKE